MMTEKKSPNPEGPEEPSEQPGQEFLPPLDFSSIILPFYSQAVLKLGLLGDPAKAEREINLGLARRLIDILDLLKDRTRGNLKPEEERFLESCLQQLRMRYLEKAKIIAA
jgi:Domain of unknown function (DUF1844)